MNTFVAPTWTSTNEGALGRCKRRTSSSCTSSRNQWFHSTPRSHNSTRAAVCGFAGSVGRCTLTLGPTGLCSKAWISGCKRNSQPERQLSRSTSYVVPWLAVASTDHVKLEPIRPPSSSSPSSSSTSSSRRTKIVQENSAWHSADKAGSCTAYDIELVAQAVGRGVASAAGTPGTIAGDTRSRSETETVVVVTLDSTVCQLVVPACSACTSTDSAAAQLSDGMPTSVAGSGPCKKSLTSQLLPSNPDSTGAPKVTGARSGTGVVASRRGLQRLVPRKLCALTCTPYVAPE
eukprot:scaffold2401_cov67-Phaeocystis_antarctica.AAC.11